ncbi:MmcQ/YjbR family DNA-binding protein [Actinomadura madurae]|uniref:MmcQ/YjbR family DNA-binding protein n=1 Tax=Actinomadura madurae TaxID=1993 RepID=UPI00202683EC|nr:MmcQ/YjbR family DNA-binding protein [Actinomadura madurae]URN10596.1 MmcQ/YjbR family DNA-binding protein [Actinomadura madurae]
MCLAVPGVVERLNHGEPSWAVRRKTLVTFSERNPEGRVGFWCPAPPGELEALVAAEPDRFFRPPFGGKGWLGVYLDVPVDWPEVAEIITEAYHLIAPRTWRTVTADSSNEVTCKRGAALFCGASNEPWSGVRGGSLCRKGSFGRPPCCSAWPPGCLSRRLATMIWRIVHRPVLRRPRAPSIQENAMIILS